MERSKDTMLLAKNTIRGKDSKDRDTLKVYLTAEQAEILATTVSEAIAAGGERGINFVFHTGKKDYQGRSFDSTFFFVKGTQDRAAFGAGGSPGGAAAPKKFVPKKVQA